ncbi:MAG: PAS domain S-box protein [Desulfobacteraceae bacterium]|jgi:PAS domain S-box-containing protein|nr:MAG: PAS domain S-box protein [Desulfobacteraceae bacterium]
MAKGPKNKKFDPEVTRIILESISDGVFTVDHNWKITSFNRAAEKITGIAAEEAIGRHCWEVFRSNMCEHDCALKRTMQKNKPFVSTSAYIVNHDKKQIPISVSTSPLIDANGRILGGVEIFRDLSLVEELRDALYSRFRMADMVSRSPAMKDIFNILPQVAESDSTVLLEGETGTGKELAARAIHDLSHRAKKPFIAINCGALPDTLLESELFGYKAGAFTNAVKDKPGHFAAAEGGTIFLDEIGETSPAFQVRLLRVIEEREYQPLGGVKKQKADIRIIAAANQSLSDLVEKGAFRRDLFYRINVVRLRMPPLRERMDDIPLLASHFIARLNRLRGKNITGLHPEAMEILMSHSFPGNIRELENIIEHAFVLCADGDIHPRHLPSHMISGTSGTITRRNGHDPVKAAEIQVINQTLARHRFNRKSTAAELGMHKTTLLRKIRKLGIKLPAVDGRSRD